MGGRTYETSVFKNETEETVHPVSLNQCRDCQNNVPWRLALLEDPVNLALLTTGHWESPTGLPAPVLSRLASEYRKFGWKVTWKNGSKRIFIHRPHGQKEGEGCSSPRAKR